MEEHPLVSIIVVTYNSSLWVRDTLDSVSAQTYPNYELIVTDDCSTDNTVEVCRHWIEKHKDSNKKITLVEAAKNTGVAGNCNRGLAEAHGEWLKFIAGDDILASTAIKDYVDYVTMHPDVRHLIAKSVHFTGQFRESDLQNPTEVSSYLYREEATVKFQYKVIRRMFFGSGPTYFINTQSLKNVGGFDERFPMQEDYPLFIKMIGKGFKMMYMDKVTVYKRMVPTSLQYDKNKEEILTKNHVRIASVYKYKYREETLDPLWKVFHYYSLWLQMEIINAGNSYNSVRCKILNFIYRATDPFIWYTRYIQKKEKSYKKSYR